MNQLPVVETTHLSKYFKNQPALCDVSLCLEKGRFYGLIGRNGAGKSTLFKLILGLLTPQEGSCRVLGQNSQELTPQIRGRIAYVNENHGLPAWMTVDQIHSFQRSFFPHWNDRLYAQILVSQSLHPAKKVGQLSRGERAGLCLALALAQSPQVLLLDEPTLGLDVVGKKAFLDTLMDSLNVDETTVLYSSHDMVEISRCVDQLIILNQGRLIDFCEPEALTERVSRWVAHFPNAVNLNRLQGPLTVRRIEDHHHITVIDGRRDFAEQLKAVGATQVIASPVNLEDAVDALLHHDPAVLRGVA